MKRMEREVAKLGMSKSSSSSSSPYSRLSPSAIPFTSNSSQTHQNWGFSPDSSFACTGYYDCQYYDDPIEAEYSFFEGSSKHSTFPASLPCDSRILSNISSSYDFLSAATIKDHQSLQTSPATMSSSNCSPTVASHDRRNFQHSYLANALKDSSSANSDTCPNPVFGPSRISTIYPAPNTLSKNLDSRGDVVDKNNEDHFNCRHANRKEPYVLLNVKDNKVFPDEVLIDLCKGGKNMKPVGEVAMARMQSPCSTVLDEVLVDECKGRKNAKPVGEVAMARLQSPCSTVLDEVLVDKCKGRKNAKPVGDGVTGPLVKKTELQINGSSVLDNLALRPRCSETNIRLETSSIMPDQNDSDVDSPCWRGLAATQSRFENFGLENERDPGPEISQPKEACSSLNPWAPQFIPGIAKRSVGYCSGEIGGDNTSSQQKVSDLATPSLPEEGPVTIRSSHSKVGNVTKTFGTNEREKEYIRNRKSSSSSVLDSSLVHQTLLLDDHFSADNLFAHGPHGGGSAETVKDSLLTDSNNAICATTYEYSPPSSKVVHNDFTKEVHGASKAFPTPLKLDVQTAVNTMHNMSEILIQHYSNDLDSFNECQYDKIKRTVDNLNVIIRIRDDQRTAAQPSHLSISDCLEVATDLQKCSNVESQLIRGDVMTAPPEHLYQQRNYSSTLIKRVLDSYHPNVVGGIRKDNALAQVILESIVRPYLSKEEMQPLALLYREMWLEASSYASHLKAEIDRWKLDNRYTEHPGNVYPYCE